MSKRAEEYANAQYPQRWVNKTPTSSEKVDYNEHARRAAGVAYEQAEKDTIRTVKTWLSEIHRVCDITDENGYRVELRNLVASLEKTMEEE